VRRLTIRICRKYKRNKKPKKKTQRGKKVIGGLWWGGCGKTDEELREISLPKKNRVKWAGGGGGGLGIADEWDQPGKGGRKDVPFIAFCYNNKIPERA